MKLNSNLLSFAAAAAAAFLWTIYSAAVWILTFLAMNLSNEAACLNFRDFDWKNELSRFAAQLFSASVIFGFAGWLAAEIYNFTSKIGDVKLK